MKEGEAAGNREAERSDRVNGHPAIAIVGIEGEALERVSQRVAAPNVRNEDVAEIEHRQHDDEETGIGNGQERRSEQEQRMFHGQPPDYLVR